MSNDVVTMIGDALLWMLDHWFIILLAVLTVTALLPLFEKPAARRKNEVPQYRSARARTPGYTHRHYCDTCRHSRWSNGACRCIKYGYIGRGGSVSCKTGCPDWLSRS